MHTLEKTVLGYLLFHFCHIKREVYHFMFNHIKGTENKIKNKFNTKEEIKTMLRSIT